MGTYRDYDRIAALFIILCIILLFYIFRGFTALIAQQSMCISLRTRLASMGVPCPYNSESLEIGCGNKGEPQKCIIKTKNMTE